MYGDLKQILRCNKSGSTGRVFQIGRIPGTILVHIVDAKGYHKKGDTQIWCLSETT